MPTAINRNTTPTRRSALGFSAAALFAGIATAATGGLTTPVLAMPVPDPDGELIALCDQFVAGKTEWYLLMEHDQWVSDFGPNKARYDELVDEESRLEDLIEDLPLPTTQSGRAALARVALTRTPLTSDGEFICDDFQAAMMLNLAEAVAADFVWPPKPGSCSTAHWAPPASPSEVSEHHAASAARWAKIDAEIQAQKQAKDAEAKRRDTPALLTDAELRGRMNSAQDFKAVIDGMHAGLSAEMARRGLT